MAGYSGTPLPRKLGIRSGSRVALVDLPPEVEALLRGSLESCVRREGGGSAIEFAMVFVRSTERLDRQFPRLARRLVPTGALWVVWPKRSAEPTGEVDERVVRTTGLRHGLVDVKICAVTEYWSGLKFVIRVKDRANRSEAVAVPRPRGRPGTRSRVGRRSLSARERATVRAREA